MDNVLDHEKDRISGLNSQNIYLNSNLLITLIIIWFLDDWINRGMKERKEKPWCDLLVWRSSIKGGYGLMCCIFELDRYNDYSFDGLLYV